MSRFTSLSAIIRAVVVDAAGSRSYGPSALEMSLERRIHQEDLSLADQGPGAKNSPKEGKLQNVAHEPQETYTSYRWNKRNVDPGT